MNKLYNTALKTTRAKADGEPDSSIDKTVYREGNITAFQHNICDGIHDEFNNASAIYSEIPWKDGYDTFNEVAGARKTDFMTYLRAINNMAGLGVPMFILCGRRDSRALECERQKEVTLMIHKCPAIIAVWNYDGELNFDTDLEAKAFITRTFKNTLDFSCGYAVDLIEGIRNSGNNLILSDIDLRCIYSILERVKGE